MKLIAVSPKLLCTQGKRRKVTGFVRLIIWYKRAYLFYRESDLLNA